MEILIIILIAASAIAFTVLGFLSGFILGFIKGMRIERPEIEAVEEEIQNLPKSFKKPKLQVSYSKREQAQMRQVADELPAPDIRKTLEDRSKGQE
jgi:hypothetical protein